MKKSRILAAVLASALAAGCSSQTSQPDSSAAVVSPASPEFSASYDNAFDFSWAAFSQIREEKKDSVFSPVSLLMALGMLEEGGNEETKTKMEELVGEDLSGLASLSKKIQDGGKELKSANSIWVKDEFKNDISPDYTDDLKKDFDSKLFTGAFDDQTLQELNSWVSRQTDGMIPSLLDHFEEDDVIALLNAIAFDAAWLDPYTEDAVSDGEFTDADGKKQTVSMMHGSEYGKLQAGGLIGFEKPYQNTRYQMAFLLPDDESKTLDETLDALNPAELHKALQDPAADKVLTTIPKFSIESSYDLSNPLKAMGLEKLFDFSDALDGMLTKQSIEEGTRLKISQAIQKAKIEVAEKGTKAGAASAIAIPAETALVEEPVSVICDRPFLFLVYDSEADCILFAGSVQQIPNQDFS